MKKIVVATGFVIALVLSALSVFAQTQSRDEILRDIAAKRAELSALEKLLLSPSEEDRAAYAEFLRLPETGLIRLLPRDTYDSEVYKKNPKTLTIRGAGAYYSFTKRTHEYGYGSDISLDSGQIQSGFAGADYGMLTNLGDVPLENVSLETPASQSLASHIPPAEEPQARLEYRRASAGATIEGTTYKNRLPVKLNSTYLVRSINYSGSDVLVAFRVVRIDADDSAIILWKLLKKYPVPHLARNN